MIHYVLIMELILVKMTLKRLKNLLLEENGYMLELIPLPEQPPIFQKTQSQKEDKKARKKKKEQDRYRRSRSKEKISRRLDKERKDKEKLKAVK